MAQEFQINSSAIESKINQLLPSQGGFGAGVDFSASTMVIPIVDLTETAEGSNVREDLQTAFSLNAITSFAVNNTTTTLVSTTGYYRVFGIMSFAGAGTGFLQLTDGITTKRLIDNFSIAGGIYAVPYDFTIFLQAGVSLQGFSNATAVTVGGTTRQIADISGNLINP